MTEMTEMLYHLLRHMGSAVSVVQQSFPPKPTWGVDDIPDLTGKVVLVTGACPK